ncbi:MAG TPA: hypothetical protein VFO39_02660 [Candidatus Sulfotelmatobacter sp.]|nr:hypothetical protein [Candidatus Sulfotelmatobacter sp.]
MIPRMNRRRLTGLAFPLVLVLLLVPSSFAHSYDYEETHTDVREFTAAGTLHVHLRVGDLNVRRGDSDKIRLRYTVRSHREHSLQRVHVDFDVRGIEATLEFHAPSATNTEVDVELEVPQNTNLDLHQSVGDLTVDGIDGDKDLTLSVGDIRVRADHTGYRIVRASTGIGDVNGEDYGETSGWLGKTLKYHGEGKYELRAHVGVGDITLDGR